MATPWSDTSLAVSFRVERPRVLMFAAQVCLLLAFLPAASQLLGAGSDSGR